MHARWRGIAVKGALIGTFSLEVLVQAQGVPGKATEQPGTIALPQTQQAPAQNPAKAPSPLLLPVPVTQFETRLPNPTEEQRFSLSFAEPIGIRELLMLIVRDTGLSVVLDPDVDGAFTGELKNVTLRQALDLSLKPVGLQYTLEDNVIRVFRRLLETRIFNINYVATRRSGSRSVSASTGANGAGGGLSGAGVGASGTPGSAGGGSGGGFGGSAASVSATDSTDFFQELQNGLQTLMSGDGRFNLDRKAGIIQVTDYPDRLDRIGFYLEIVETRVNRQVQIQAKVIEVELSDGYTTGINWATLFKNAGNNVTLTQSLAPANLAGAFTLGVKIRDFTALLQAFGTQGKVKVLSAPLVMAMNNEPAVMRVGTQDIFFVTTSQVDATTGRVLQTVVTPQSITEGVVLSVTPQISENGTINLSISPTITDRTGQATSRLGDTVPIISVRETDTLVRVQQGETVVIAGLMQERVTNDVTKVPVLGDVPLIGQLFRSNDKQKRKTDLIILLTPTLLAPDVIAAEAIRQQERLYEEQRSPIVPVKK
jgi:MSHA biogenesis protein MshL